MNKTCNKAQRNKPIELLSRFQILLKRKAWKPQILY